MVGDELGSLGRPRPWNKQGREKVLTEHRASLRYHLSSSDSCCVSLTETQSSRWGHSHFPEEETEGQGICSCLRSQS